MATASPSRPKPEQIRNSDSAAASSTGPIISVARLGGWTLLLLALLLPAHATAVALVGGGSARLRDVVAGVWIFKGCLALHGALLMAARRVSFGSGEALVPGASRAARVLDSRRDWLVLGGLLVAAATLRLIALDAGLWFDEIQTLIRYARLPLGQIVATYDSQNQHVLYSVLAKLAVQLFGESNAALRTPAVLFGVASLGALYWFGCLVTSRREALLATALLTFSYHHVWFSQNARGYTAMLFWALLCSGLFLRLIQSPITSWKPVLAYAVAAAAGVFTQITFVLLVASHAVIWLALALSRRSVAPRTRWLPFVGFVIAGTLSLQLYALLLPQMLHVLTHPTTASAVNAAWKSPWWLITETVGGLTRGIPGGLLTIAAGAAIGLGGLITYLRQSRTVTAVMVLPGAVTAAAIVLLHHNLWPRFFFFLAGFAVLIFVRGVMAVWELLRLKRFAIAPTVALLLVTLASALTVPTAWHPKQDYAAARDYILSHSREGDAIVAVDLARSPFENYLHTKWLSATNSAELEQIERQHARTWVVYTFPARLSAAQPDVWDRLQRQYSPAAEFPGTVGGGAIVIKVRS